MGRIGLALIWALAMVGAAQAQQALLNGRSPDETAAKARCAAMGPGFFVIDGSTACLKISGHISAGAGFTAGASVDRAAVGPPPAGAFAELGVSADSRFDTPMGLGRIYVDVRDANGPRWLTENQ